MALGTMGTKENARFVIEALGLHPYLSHWRSDEVWNVASLIPTSSWSA